MSDRDIISDKFDEYVDDAAGGLVSSCDYESFEAGWQAARAQGEIQVPNEQGKNRYGLDMAYFRNLFNRELNRPLVDFRPDELARVLARAARTADAAVLQEPEFQAARAQNGQGAEPVKPGDPLPCPFCGSTDVGGAGGTVGCYRCPAEIAVQNANTAYAVELWNNRVKTQPQTAQQGGVPRWKELEALADEYVEGYEFRGDEGDYQPNERERFLIEDCVAGLMDEVHQMLKRTKPQPAQQGSVPEGITVEMLDAIWQAGIDAENYDDRDFCDPLIRARIAIEESTTPQPQGDGWVKCSERLPRPRKNTRKAPNGILVKFNTGRVAQIHDVTETLVARMKGGPRHPAKFEATTPPRIVEWMDLDNPQPPKEGE